MPNFRQQRGTLLEPTTTVHRISPQPIEGAVDKDVQRGCVGSRAGKDLALVEAGISNATLRMKFQSAFHFEDGQTTSWLLVRIEEPTASDSVRVRRARFTSEQNARA